MDPTTRKIIELISSPDLELRGAAIRVLSELEINGKAVVQALGKTLREPRESLQILALKALGRFGAGDVASYVVPLILSDGVLGEHAMAAVTAMGIKAAPYLQRLYDEADPQGRRSVITALAGINGKPALSFLIGKIPDEPFDLQKHLVSSICDALDCSPPPEQAKVFPLVARILDGASGGRVETQIAAINILGHFRGESMAARGRRLLIRASDKKQPLELRRYALLSLVRLTDEAKVTPDYLRFLHRMLCDPDWQNIAQHALASLKRITLGRSLLPLVADLVSKSPHLQVKTHILSLLGGLDRPDVAKEIIPFLSDQRLSVREKAEETLRGLPSAVESLFSLLRSTSEVDVRQRVSELLKDFPLDVRRRHLDSALRHLMELLDLGDAGYQPFLDYVRSVDPDPLRRMMYRKASALKKGRLRDRWQRIARHLQLLWDHHMITSEGRYLFAVALLRMNPHDLSPAARRVHLGLQVLKALIYDDQDRLLRTLKADKDLTAEDYFFLGFHFVEECEATRAFGVALLEHVGKRFPRSAVAGPAAHKLQAHLRAAEEARSAGEKKSRKRAPPKVNVAPLPQEDLDLDVDVAGGDPWGDDGDEGREGVSSSKRSAAPKRSAGADGSPPKPPRSAAKPAAHAIDGRPRPAVAMAAAAGSASGAKAAAGKSIGGKAAGGREPAASGALRAPSTAPAKPLPAKSPPAKSPPVKAPAAKGKVGGGAPAAGKRPLGQKGEPAAGRASGAKSSRGKSAGKKVAATKTPPSKSGRDKAGRKASGGKSGAVKPRGSKSGGGKGGGGKGRRNASASRASR